MMFRFMSVLFVFVVFGAACGKDESKDTAKAQQQTQPAPPPVQGQGQAQPSPGTAAPGTTAAANTPEADARQLFNMRCAMCHGATGKGDGPAAANINPKPRNYTSEKWQKSVTDEQIAEVIRKGGQAMGLNPMMPAQPDLTDEQLKSLVALIRSFGEE